MSDFMEKMICILAVKCALVLIVCVPLMLYIVISENSVEDTLVGIYILLGACAYLICFLIYGCSEGVTHYVAGFSCGATVLCLTSIVIYVVIVAFIHSGWEVFLYL